MKDLNRNTFKDMVNFDLNTEAQLRKKSKNMEENLKLMLWGSESVSDWHILNIKNQSWANNTHSLFFAYNLNQL